MGFSYSDVVLGDDNELRELFSTENTAHRDPDYEMPDFEPLARELSKPGVTVKLLWEEYCDRCRLADKRAYGLTQFRKHFNSYLAHHDFVSVIRHKAGERTEVDWAGTKVSWADPDTGEIVYGCLFVGVLSFSGYAFAMATPDMKMSSWISAHNEMFRYFGGSSAVLVPDNLKTGVLRHNDHEVILNRTYEDMADHYGMIILPARVKKPKDKAHVENLVGKLTTHIIARMRNYQFFSIDEYNEQLMKELDRFNHLPFQKKEGSRASVFEEIEKPLLRPLPPYPYELCEWREAKVQNNCHIAFEKNYYSVPFEHMGQKVMVKIFDRRIEIHSDGILLCTHRRLHNRIGAYETDESHMPPDSRHYGDWNSTRYLNWAKQIGPNTYQVIFNIFRDVKTEQTCYRSVHAILKLADSHSYQRLENACRYALRLFARPTYKNIKTIIRNNEDICQTDVDDSGNIKGIFVRGGEYFE